MARRIPFRDFLSNSPLLDGLDLDSRDAVARAIRPRPFQQDEVIFEQGDTDTRGCMLIMAGSVRVELEEDGLRAPVAILGKGDLVGAERLFDTRFPRHAWILGEERGLGAFIPGLVYEEASRLGHRLAANIELLALTSFVRRDRLSRETYVELLRANPTPRWQGA